MKKSLLLSMVALALGGSAITAQAQEAATKKIRIILKEKNGEAQVFEYNSSEEMQADPRLKGKRLPLLQEALQRPYSRRYEEDSALLREKWEGGERTVENNLYIDVLKSGAFKLEELPEEAQALLKEHGLSLHEGEKVMIVGNLDKMPEPPQPPAVQSPSVPGEALAVPQLPAPPDPVETLAELPLPASPPVPEDAPDWLEELRVYPNPSDDQLRVRFRTNTPGATVLKLIDMNGKVVYSEAIPDAGMTIEKTIKPPKGQKGIFLLQLEQGGRKYTERVLLR